MYKDVPTFFVCVCMCVSVCVFRVWWCVLGCGKQEDVMSAFSLCIPIFTSRIIYI